MGELRRRLPPSIPRFYYPVDFPRAVRRAFNTFRPKALILVEAEIWPNFLWQALERKAEIFLGQRAAFRAVFPQLWAFSARFFARSFPNFAPPVARKQAMPARLTALGFAPENVRIVGNLKFDAAQPEPRGGLDTRALLRQIGVSDHAKILVAGSTHAGEEAVLAEMLARLRQRCPELFLVLVPRHFERAREVGQELAARGVSFVYRSEIGHAAAGTTAAPQCLLVNSTGELKFFYEVADVVFVGKSLTAKGGQNPIEPAALGKAIVLGPNMQNFTSMTRAFLAQQAVIQVPDAAALEAALAELLASDARRAEIGARALAVVRKNLGSHGAHGGISPGAIGGMKNAWHVGALC